jgi:hypothetical protein
MGDDGRDACSASREETTLTILSCLRSAQHGGLRKSNFLALELPNWIFKQTFNRKFVTLSCPFHYFHSE